MAKRKRNESAVAGDRPAKRSLETAPKLNRLSPELLRVIFEYLPRNTLKDILRVHSYFEDTAGKLLWKDVSLNLSTHPFPNAILDKWRVKGLWDSTDTLRVCCLDKTFAQATLRELLPSIPRDKIKMLSFTPETSLSDASARALSEFLANQLRLEKVVLLKFSASAPYQLNNNTYKWLGPYLAFRVCLSQPSPHRKLNEIIALHGNDLSIPIQLLEIRAAISSVDMWGYDHPKGGYPACDF